MSIKLKEIYRYPVKSMGGGTLDAITLESMGIPGDRCWAVKDDRESIKGGKRFPALMDLRAELLGDPSPTQPSPDVAISASDGRRVQASDANVNATLSEFIGETVSLWPLVPKEQLDHYLRRPTESDDPEADLRAVFARTDDEPLPDLSQFPQELFTYESPPGTYFDAFPLLAISEASLASMASAGPESNFDVRRFRPNLVFTGTEQGFAENQWAGRQAKLGDATLSFTMRCPRCVMTTHAFADLPKDPQVMRHLVKQNQGELGVYAEVVQPGRIQCGDVLELLS